MRSLGSSSRDAERGVGPRSIPGGQRVPKGFLEMSVLFEPQRCPLVQLRDLARVYFHFDLAQKVGKQGVVTEPLVLLIERRCEHMSLLETV